MQTTRNSDWPRALFLALALVVLCHVEQPNIVAQYALNWEHIGDLPYATAFHEIVKLDPARVMVLGGESKGVAMASCAIIDAETRSVRKVASMRFERAGFTAIGMPNGRVYVLGGQSSVGGKGVSIIEEYDPLTDTWAASGYLVEGRGQVCGTAINDHEIIVIGGRIGSSDVRRTCEIFDINTGVSRRISDFPYNTSFAKVIVADDGRIFCFSGRSGGPGSYRTGAVHEYNLYEDRWIVAGELQSAVYYPTLVKLADGKHCLVGGSWREGNTSDEFATVVQKQEDASFRNVTHMTSPRAGHGVANLNHGTVIAVGGADNSKGSYKSTEFINIVSGVVERGPDLLFARSYCLAVDVMVNGDPAVVVIGGKTSDGAVRQIELLKINEIDQTTSCHQSFVHLVPNQDLISFVGQSEDAGAHALLNRMETHSAGAIWFKDQFKISAGFVTEFSFRLNDGSDNGAPDGSPEGGNGLAVVIQGMSETPLGLPGAGLGYDQMVNGLAIEFDTYSDQSHSDPDLNHIAVQKGDGYALRSVHQAPFNVGWASVGVPDFRADGTVYYGRVEYFNGKLQVWVNDTQMFDEPSLSINIDIGNALTFRTNDMAWIGITGSTGTAIQSHEILTWDLAACTTQRHEGKPPRVRDSHISIYPMPTSEVASVNFTGEEWSIAQVRVMSLMGEVVLERTVTTSSFDISVTGIPAGTYILNIEFDGRSTSTIWNVVR